MEVSEAIQKRRNIRRYTGDAIDQEDLQKMLKASRDAPSFRDLKPWKFVVVIDPFVFEDLVSVCHDQPFIKDVGAFIIGLVDDIEWAEIDLAIAMDHLSLRAVDLGYGTCWIRSFDREGLKKEIDIPEDYKVKICITIGVPDEIPESRTKRSIDELVEWVEIEED